MENASWRDDEEYWDDLPEDEYDEANEPLCDEEVQDPQTRVKLLGRYFVLHLFWFAAWLMAGFFAAYFIIPDDWEEGLRLMVYSVSIFSALFLGRALLKIRVKYYSPDNNDTGTFDRDIR